MMSLGWTWYIIALAVLNLGGCVWLLWWTSRRKPGDPKPEDTSHYWDGDITEFNKPMPRWWINGFYLLLIYAVGYLFWYGGLGSYQGYSKWSSAGEHARTKQIEDAKLETTFAPFHGQPIDVIAGNPEAIKLGRAIFNNTCATCHGSSAQGALGFPNLSDNVWKWGSKPDDILTTVMEGRTGVMPPWGKVLAGMGGQDATDYVIAYMRQLGEEGGTASRNDYAATRGKSLYDGLCVSCHGVEGKGNQLLGAPDLTDDVWLYGSTTASLRETINNGRIGEMPPHGPIIGETRARLVSAYVWSLSHPASAATAKAP